MQQMLLIMPVGCDVAVAVGILIRHLLLRRRRHDSLDCGRDDEMMTLAVQTMATLSLTLSRSQGELMMQMMTRLDEASSPFPTPMMRWADGWVGWKR